MRESSDATVTREAGEGRGRYVLRRDGHEAELTYSVAGPRLVIADHTGVPGPLRNGDVGSALVERLVADARAEGFRIVPLCPFVNAMRRRHPDWADAFEV